VRVTVAFVKRTGESSTPQRIGTAKLHKRARAWPNLAGFDEPWIACSRASGQMVDGPRQTCEIVGMPNKKPAHYCPNKLWVPKEAVEGVPEAQVKFGRHRCTVCAYASGYAEGLAEARRRLNQPSRKEPRKRRFVVP
jgi:hypothetical protein